MPAGTAGYDDLTPNIVQYDLGDLVLTLRVDPRGVWARCAASRRR